METFGKVVRIGFKMFAGFAAGYFVHRMINDKAEELIDEGGAANAFLIGAGEAAVVASVASLAFYIAE